jgi:hypothetical protein
MHGIAPTRWERGPAPRAGSAGVPARTKRVIVAIVDSRKIGCCISPSPTPTPRRERPVPLGTPTLPATLPVSLHPKPAEQLSHFLKIFITEYYASSGF